MKAARITLYTVCRECGARWETTEVRSPNRCINEECDAGWLDIPQFADKAYADEAAETFEAERVTS